MQEQEVVHQLVSNPAELHKFVEVSIPYIANAIDTVVMHQGLDSVSYSIVDTALRMANEDDEGF